MARDGRRCPACGDSAVGEDDCASCGLSRPALARVSHLNRRAAIAVRAAWLSLGGTLFGVASLLLGYHAPLAQPHLVASRLAFTLVGGALVVGGLFLVARARAA